MTFNSEMFFNQIPGLILWEKNIESIYLRSNNECAKLCGFATPQSMIGITDHDIRRSFAELASDFRNCDRQVISAKKSKKLFEILNCGKDKWKIILVTKVPIFKHNDVIGTLGHGVDVTIPFFKLGHLLTNRLTMGKRANLMQGSYTIGQNSFANVTLTSRQSECLFFLLRNKTAKEIAILLKLSPRTIEDHIDQLRSKFNCNTKRELIDIATEKGFLNIIPEQIFSRQLSVQLE